MAAITQVIAEGPSVAKVICNPADKHRRSTFNQHLKRVNVNLMSIQRCNSHVTALSIVKKSPYKYIRYPVFNIYQEDMTLGLQYRSTPTDVCRPVQKKNHSNW